MSRRYKHILAVEIKCLDPQGQRQAQDRLLRWLETYGHTDTSHGFGFVNVGVITGKRLTKEAKRTTTHE